MNYDRGSQTVFAAFLAVIVLFTSGCVDLNFLPSNVVSFGSGISIINFEPEIDTAYSNEKVNFMLKIKNTGSFEASGAVKIDVGEWRCLTSSSGDFDKLIPPSEERGTEGQEMVFKWECTAPDIEEGIDVPFQARAEVEYEYKTVTSKSITLLPTRELITLRDSGKALPSELVSTTHSPVSVNVLIEGPIRIVDGSTSVEFPVTIEVKNAGNGVVQGSEVKIDVKGEGLTQQGCNIEELHLWRGQSQSVTCKMKSMGLQNVITQGRIVVTADYTYTTTATTAITVIGG